MDEMKQFIQFKLGLNDYAVEMNCVREIIKPVKVIDLLGAPEFVQGIAKVRDGVVTIIDLRKKFVIEPADEGEPRIMIFESAKETEKVGLWVDDVVEILESNSLEKIPNIIHQGTIKEIIKTKDNIIPVLDIEQLFSNEVLSWLNSANPELSDSVQGK
ncbi:chemotaxis protein CheW [Desulfosporosinus sp.]|uniref:chemotaxis protein CheW n=1 Tax=Desulfosporosinus sp. TaxID=157907 RepID=UPI000E947191|nr:chemotaxis protein CheW [Desulfosporosinus sp.]MBC2723011.1 chemotaxis protein CheW [Desulfosporosinus sp.]MBC2727209.1 chemotaxis protein CheW [Desulfosporosinus sp.]HBV88262.1 chemotaxis protein [Desulfosporosinus sp.]